MRCEVVDLPETVAFWTALRLLLVGPYSFSYNVIAEEGSAGTDTAEGSAGQAPGGEVARWRSQDRSDVYIDVLVSLLQGQLQPYQAWPKHVMGQEHTWQESWLTLVSAHWARPIRVVSAVHQSGLREYSLDEYYMNGHPPAQSDDSS